MTTQIGKGAPTSPLTSEVNDLDMQQLQSVATAAARHTVERIAERGDRQPAPMYAAIQNAQHRMRLYPNFLRPCYSAAFEPTSGSPIDATEVSENGYQVAGAYASPGDGVMWAHARVADVAPGIPLDFAEVRNAGASLTGSHLLELNSPMTLYVGAPARVIGLGMLKDVAAAISPVGFCGYRAELTLKVRADSGAAATHSLMIIERWKSNADASIAQDNIDTNLLLEVSLAAKQNDRLTAKLTLLVTALRSETGGWATLGFSGLNVGGQPAFFLTEGAVLFDQFYVESASRCRRFAVGQTLPLPISVPVPRVT